MGLHRVLAPAGSLPQAAERLDASPAIGPDEVRLRVERLNLDAASFRQLATKHDGDGAAVRREVLEIVAARGKMQNPVTGSGGMLVGVVDEVGPESPLGLQPGDRVATLVSLSLTPLLITDGLARWDGRSEQVPAEGTPSCSAARSRPGCPTTCPASSRWRSWTSAARRRSPPGWSRRTRPAPGSRSSAVRARAARSSLAAARRAGARTVGIVPVEPEAALLREVGLADEVALADARDPVARGRRGRARARARRPTSPWCASTCPAASTARSSSTADGGTVIFFSMATSFSAAALGAEGLAADVTMLIGNGYVPGHAELAMDLLRTEPGVRSLFERRLAHEAG